VRLISLSVNNYDIFLAVMWLVIGLHNRKAFIMLATLVCYTTLQAVTPTNFHAFLIASSLYFLFAQENIRYLSRFRQIFLCFGVVYFFGAIDQAVYYHFDFDTRFDRIQPYLITIINAYALATLIDSGGKQDAGFVDYITRNCASWFNGLSLHKTCQKDHTR